MNKILESVKFVAQRSKDVTIDQSTIDKFCEDFKPTDCQDWLDEAPYKIHQLNFKDQLHFVLALDSICFSFWGSPKWTIDFHNERHDGAYGLVAALGRAIENNFPILDGNFLSKISESDFQQILAANVKIPLLPERLNNWHQVGTILIDKFDNDFTNLIQMADNSAEKLFDLIIKNFSSFEDSSAFQGKTIYFYKRAQLLVADINRILEVNRQKSLDNLDCLTAFSDYKLPMVLRKLGILKYSDHLASLVDQKEEIPKDSTEEIEIRASTIWAIELMTQKAQTKFPKVNALRLDEYLFNLGRQKSPGDKPYHLTRTTAY